MKRQLTKLLLLLFAAALTIFNGCKKDVNHQTVSAIKGSSSPAPDGYTMTSVGLIPDSNITLIESGYKLSFVNGHAYKMHIATGRLVRDLGKVMPGGNYQRVASPGVLSPAGNAAHSPRAGAVFGNSGATNNWITYSEWQNTGTYPITNFTTNWTVPTAPATVSGQLFSIWMGLMPTDSSYPSPSGQQLPLLQPLLIWGNSGGQIGGGNSWTIVSYIIWKNAAGAYVAAISTPVHNVPVGTALQAQISSSGQKADGSYNCVIQFIGQTSLTVSEGATLNNAAGGTVAAPFIPALNYACEVLEIPTGSPYITSSSEYPYNGVPLTSTVVTTGFGSNATNPYVSWISSSASGLANGAANNEHLDVISSSQVNMYFQKAPVISYPSPDYYNINTNITPLNVTSTGGIINSYATSFLPSNLVVNATTGQITGMPTYNEAAYNYIVTATGPGGTGSFPINITTQLPGISFGITNNSANGLSLGFIRTDISQPTINYIAPAFSGTNHPASIPAGTYTIRWNPSGSPANCIVTLSNGQSSPNTPGGMFTGVVINNTGGVNSLSAH